MLMNLVSKLKKSQSMEQFHYKLCEKVVNHEEKYFTNEARLQPRNDAKIGVISYAG